MEDKKLDLNMEEYQMEEYKIGINIIYKSII